MSKGGQPKAKGGPPPAPSPERNPASAKWNCMLQLQKIACHRVV